MTILAKIRALIWGNKQASLLIIASFGGQILVFLFNFLVGKVLPLSDLAVFSLVGSFNYLALIPLSLLGSAMTIEGGILLGSGGAHKLASFWNYMRRHAYIWTLATTLVWLAGSMFLQKFFHLESILPILSFTLVFVAGYIMIVDRSYLSVTHKFALTAGIVLLESISKIVILLAFSAFGLVSYAYMIAPITAVITTVLSALCVYRFLPTKATSTPIPFTFPVSVAFLSTMSNLASNMYLSFDMLMVKHYLPPHDAGTYALVALFGKIVYFLGFLVLQLITPYVSRMAGAGKNPQNILYLTFSLVLVLTCGGTFGYILVGDIFMGLLLGKAKLAAISPYIVPFMIGMCAFTLSRVIEIYYLSQKIYSFSVVATLLATLQILLIALFHTSVWVVVLDMVAVGGFALLVLALMHFFAKPIIAYETHIRGKLRIRLPSKNLESI